MGEDLKDVIREPVLQITGVIVVGIAIVQYACRHLETGYSMEPLTKS